MSCKSLIDVATTTSSAVAATNGILPLATITRRNGCDVNLGNNSIILTDCGSNYFLVTVTVTFTALVDGVVTVNLQQNGTNVTGATGSSTITTATTEVRSISFSKVIRTFNSRGIDTLSLVNTGIAATFTSIDVAVIKL